MNSPHDPSGPDILAASRSSVGGVSRSSTSNVDDLDEIGSLGPSTRDHPGFSTMLTVYAGTVIVNEDPWNPETLDWTTSEVAKLPVKFACPKL